MAKLTLQALSSLIGNETSALSTINANMVLIEAALELTLSRDGTAPNPMSADFDLNSNDLLNGGALGGTSLTVSGTVTGGNLVIGGVDLNVAAAAAAASAAAALVSELAAATSASNAEDSATESAASADRITVSTLDPSGGNDNDIWLKVAV